MLLFINFFEAIAILRVHRPIVIFEIWAFIFRLLKLTGLKNLNRSPFDTENSEIVIKRRGLVKGKLKFICCH